MILIIDNYDSFTYNLVQVIGALQIKRPIKVVRNDAATLEEIDAWNPRHVIISPGPGTPDDGGISMNLIKHLAGKTPILGVCLGHQCIAQAYGGRIARAPRLMHGKTSPIRHDQRGIFHGLSNPFTATRYHSLIVERGTFPPDFDITAWTDRDELMGMRHRSLPLEGVQFHPESFLTEQGPQLLANFLRV